MSNILVTCLVLKTGKFKMLRRQNEVTHRSERHAARFPARLALPKRIAKKKAPFSKCRSLVRNEFMISLYCEKAHKSSHIHRHVLLIKINALLQI